jgi:hypothetical protein
MNCSDLLLEAGSILQSQLDGTELGLLIANPVKDLIVVRTPQHHLCDPPIRKSPQSCPLSILPV